ncbi:MAG: hypothetical protein RR253_07090, partial [Oscillospiraceae bacterium]
SGKTITVTSALTKTIGVSAEKCKDKNVFAGISIATGAAAQADDFVNDKADVVPKRVVTLTNNVVSLTRYSDTDLGMNITLPNSKTVGADRWSHNPSNAYVDFEIPFWVRSGDIVLGTKVGTGAVVQWDGTTKPTLPVAVAVGAGNSITTNIPTPITDGNKIQYFTVTAGDGTQKTYKISLITSAQSPTVINFNFDGTTSNRKSSEAKAVLRGLPDGDYTFKEVGTDTVVANLSAKSAGETMTFTATALYCDAIDSLPNGWVTKEITGTGIKVASHERSVDMYNSENEKVGTILIHANNASVTDLAIVVGINGNLPTSYFNAYQWAADLTNADTNFALHSQNPANDTLNLLGKVESEEQAKAYIDTYVAKAVTAFDDTVSSGEVQDALNAVPKKYATVVNEKKFIAPIAGTAENPQGVNGTYYFTVTVACGGAGATVQNPPQGAAIETPEQKIAITAHAYAGASVEEINTQVGK